MAVACFALTAMAGAFGLLSDNHLSHFSTDRLVEANARLNIWDLLQCGALTEGAVTEVRYGDKGHRLASLAPNILVDGNRVPIVWDEPMEGVARPWFECPRCRRRCQHIFLSASTTPAATCTAKRPLCFAWRA